MKKYLTAVLFFMCLGAQAQTNEDNEVIAVINGLFANMQKFDTAAMRSCFHPDARLQSVSRKIKTTTLKTESLDEFLKQVGNMKSDTLKIEERVLSFEVKSDGLIANVWAPYEFYVNGKISHQGIDVFQLYHAPGNTWQIIYICDTRRRR